MYRQGTCVSYKEENEKDNCFVDNISITNKWLWK